MQGRITEISDGFAKIDFDDGSWSKLEISGGVSEAELSALVFNFNEGSPEFWNFLVNEGEISPAFIDNYIALGVISIAGS